VVVRTNRSEPPDFYDHEAHELTFSSIATQLQWCAAEAVPVALITHCGSEIVAGDERKAEATIRALGRDLGVTAKLAYDGLKIRLR
jgi:hypothetical protein